MPSSRPRFWLLAALVAAIVLLALAFRSNQRPKGLADFEAAGSMRQIATADVSALQLATPARRIELARGASGWQRADTKTALDAAAVEAVEAALRLLHNTPPERSFDSATPEFGLDPAALSVQVQIADGRRFAIEFGAANPMGLARYARVRSGSSASLQLMPGYVAEAWEGVVARVTP